LRANKERTSSQIPREVRPSTFEEIWKRCAKWGHSECPIHFTQPSTQLPLKFGRFSLGARYTVTRITFLSTRRDAASTDKDFSVRGTASSPRYQRSHPQRLITAEDKRIVSLPPQRRQPVRETQNWRGVPDTLRQFWNHKQGTMYSGR